MKLSQKLLIGTAAISLTVGGVGLYSASVGQANLQAAIERTSAARAVAVADEIDRVLHTRIAEWQAYARSGLVRRTLRNANASMAQLPDVAAEIRDRDREWRRATGETAFMRELL